VALRKQEKVATVQDIRTKIIESKNKTEVIAVLLQHFPGINSDTEPGDEWWKKREKLGVGVHLSH